MSIASSSAGRLRTFLRICTGTDAVRAPEAGAECYVSRSLCWGVHVSSRFHELEFDRLVLCRALVHLLAHLHIHISLSDPRQIVRWQRLALHRRMLASWSCYSVPGLLCTLHAGRACSPRLSLSSHS